MIDSAMVWKTPLADAGEQEIKLPYGYSPLAVQVQRGQICMWGKVDPLAAEASYTVHIVGTGQPINIAGLRYVGTVQDGDFVWHVFIGGPNVERTV